MDYSKFTNGGHSQIRQRVEKALGGRAGRKAAELLLKYFQKDFGSKTISMLKNYQRKSHLTMGQLDTIFNIAGRYLKTTPKGGQYSTYDRQSVAASIPFLMDRYAQLQSFGFTALEIEEIMEELVRSAFTWKYRTPTCWKKKFPQSTTVAQVVSTSTTQTNMKIWPPGEVENRIREAIKKTGKNFQTAGGSFQEFKTDVLAIVALLKVLKDRGQKIYGIEGWPKEYFVTRYPLDHSKVLLVCVKPLTFTPKLDKDNNIHFEASNGGAVFVVPKIHKGITWDQYLKPLSRGQTAALINEQCMRDKFWGFRKIRKTFVKEILPKILDQKEKQVVRALVKDLKQAEGVV